MLKPIKQNEEIFFPTKEVSPRGCSSAMYWCVNSLAICFETISLA